MAATASEAARAAGQKTLAEGEAGTLSAVGQRRRCAAKGAPRGSQGCGVAQGRLAARRGPWPGSQACSGEASGAPTSFAASAEPCQSALRLCAPALRQQVRCTGFRRVCGALVLAPGPAEWFLGLTVAFATRDRGAQTPAEQNNRQRKSAAKARQPGRQNAAPDPTLHHFCLPGNMGQCWTSSRPSLQSSTHLAQL